MDKLIVERAAEVLSKMTEDEKIALIAGVDFMFTTGVPRLGIRKIRMADASMGLRDGQVPTTAFPATIALAATWDRATALAYGAAVGAEFRAAGVDVVLGPGVNIYRVPQCGRNFEYLGEDPFLAGVIATAYIRGVQSEGVAATVKHLAANNQDWHRCSSNSVMALRTLREVYLPAFKAAIHEGGVLSVMTSYNLLNGEYPSESRRLINDLILEEWGFEGLIMSDWYGTWSPEKAFDSGLHLEMPGGKTWKPGLVKEMLAGNVDRQAELDRKATRVLQWTLAIEKLQGESGQGRGKCREHRAVALDVARNGIVLLKNESSLLPLTGVAKRINILGPWAAITPTSGGGAALVEAIDPKSVLGSLLEIAPDWQWVRGDKDLEKADAVIVCVGFGAQLEREGSDRPFELPWDQEELVRRCVAANAHTIVVVFAGGGIGMKGWVDSAGAILHAWYPGEVGALAVAEILVGEVNPSGKLPISIERSGKDAPAFNNYLPADGSLYEKPDFVGRGRETFDVRYEEGIFCGYRHYDRMGTEPLFPFGHGLSYTSFEYSGFSVRQTDAGVEAGFTIANTGRRDGDEVAQAYLGVLSANVPRPKWELKAFKRLTIKAGEKIAVSLPLSREAFAHFDETGGRWKCEPGDCLVGVGSSAREIHFHEKIEIHGY